MNNDTNNQYQENQNYIDPNTNTQGYNDTYYNNNYNSNNNNDSEPENKEQSKGNLLKVLIIVVIIAILGIGIFYFLNKKGNGEAEYTLLTKQLCDAALEYEGKNPDIIDTKTPGSTAYITLQKLSDAYLIDSVIKDPRNNKTMPLTTYVRLAVASNGEVYCESVVDTGDDKTAPILTLIGGNEVTILKGTNFVDPGAKALDDVDGDITAKITRSGTVDVTKAGTYKITYRVTDASGNSSSKDRTIYVKEYKDLDPTAAALLDVTPPQIEIRGNNPYCLELGKKYIEPGVIAVDNVDGVITNRIIVDNKATGERLGTFRVTYTVSDTAGNKSVAYRSVEVKSSCGAVTPPTNPTPVNTRPTISLIGDTSMIWNLHDPYIDRGATAWDKEDGNLTQYIRINATSVNVDAPGIYSVYYEVSDSKGLKANVTRTVTVANTNSPTNPPVAHFLEIPYNMNIPVGSPRVIPVPGAQDDKGNALTVAVITKGPAGNVISAVDFYTVGVYTIIYTATPAGGVSQSVTRIVTIYDTAAPILTAPSSITLPKRDTNCGLTIDDLSKAGVKATDSSNSRQARIIIKSGAVDVCKVNNTGTDIQVYAEDDYGNKSDAKTINVKISDGTAPTLVTGVDILNCGKDTEGIRLAAGSKYQLSYEIYPTLYTLVAGPDPRTVTWSSNNNPVATVDNKGLITAVGKGSADIKIRTDEGGKESICSVIVTEAAANVPVTDVIMQGCEGGSLTLDKGRMTTLTAVVKPDNATNKSVGWTSSNLSIVSLNANGIIKGEAVGNATVTVTTNDGNKSKTCNVTVRQPQIVDSTPPSKVTVVANTANASDPYNKNNAWAGGATNKTITLTVESSDAESGICSFELVRPGNQVTAFSPLASSPNRGTFVWTTDANESIQIRAVNCGNVKGELSDPISVKLDNTGPVTTFTQALTADQWTKEKAYTVKYNATDGGVGLQKYQYTYDDVHAANFDPTKVSIEGETATGEANFNEDLIKNGVYVKYVFVRAIDNLGNYGVWTSVPAWLNMDSIAPQAPGMTVTNNNTGAVTVSLSFTDGASPKQSGFGKYTYKLDGASEQAINTQNGALNITAPGQHKMEAWAYDKAGNMSTASVKQGAEINVLKPLSVSCPHTSITTGTKIVCNLSGTSANEVGVKLECLNGSYSRSFTTTSSDKTIYCIPSNTGTLTVKATKAGWAEGTTTVTVTKAAAPTPAPSITTCPSSIGYARGSTVTVKSDIASSWSVSGSGFTGTAASSTSYTVTNSTGVTSGSVTVTATANGKTDTCTIRVSSPPSNDCTLGAIGQNDWSSAPTISSTTACSNITADKYVRTHTYKICIKSSDGSHNVWGSSYTHYITPTITRTGTSYTIKWVETLHPETASGSTNVDQSPNPATLTGTCTLPTASIACTASNYSGSRIIYDGYRVNLNETVSCTASSGVSIYCIGAGNNGSAMGATNSKSCKITSASLPLKVIALPNNQYNGKTVSFPVNQ